MPPPPFFYHTLPVHPPPPDGGHPASAFWDWVSSLDNTDGQQGRARGPGPHQHRGPGGPPQPQAPPVPPPAGDHGHGHGPRGPPPPPEFDFNSLFQGAGSMGPWGWGGWAGPQRGPFGGRHGGPPHGRGPWGGWGRGRSDEGFEVRERRQEEQGHATPTAANAEVASDSLNNNNMTEKGKSPAASTAADNTNEKEKGNDGEQGPHHRRHPRCHAGPRRNHPACAPGPHQNACGESSPRGHCAGARGRGNGFGPGPFGAGPGSWPYRGRRWHRLNRAFGGPEGVDLNRVAQVFATRFFPGFDINSIFPGDDAHARGADNAAVEEDFTPAADMFDTPASYIIHVELPGAEKTDVSVSFETVGAPPSSSGPAQDGAHTVPIKPSTSASKNEDTKDNKNPTPTTAGGALVIAGVLYRPGVDEVMTSQLAVGERKIGVFRKVIRIDGAIDEAQIRARLEGGILRVVVPKVGTAGSGHEHANGKQKAQEEGKTWVTVRERELVDLSMGEDHLDRKQASVVDGDDHDDDDDVTVGGDKESLAKRQDEDADADVDVQMSEDEYERRERESEKAMLEFEEYSSDEGDGSEDEFVEVRKVDVE